MIHAYSCDFMRYEHLDFFVIHCYPERWRTFSGARQAKRSVAIARWNDWGENRGIQLAIAKLKIWVAQRSNVYINVYYVYMNPVNGQLIAQRMYDFRDKSNTDFM